MYICNPHSKFLQSIRSRKNGNAYHNFHCNRSYTEFTIPNIGRPPETFSNLVFGSSQNTTWSLFKNKKTLISRNTCNSNSKSNDNNVKLLP